MVFHSPEIRSIQLLFFTNTFFVFWVLFSFLLVFHHQSAQEFICFHSTEMHVPDGANSPVYFNPVSMSKNRQTAAILGCCTSWYQRLAKKSDTAWQWIRFFRSGREVALEAKIPLLLCRSCFSWLINCVYTNLQRM